MKVKVTILTGAGISAESGIKTFRDHNGLWENHNIYEVATFEAFKNNPQLVHQFYNQRREQLLSDEVSFNQAHRVLALLEENNNFQVNIITQNVDDLHERAGSKNVIHMHGELLKSRCINCGDIRECKINLEESIKCNNCNTGHSLRPHIVWFGEEVMGIEKCVKLVSECDYFLVIGTSSNVFPASSLINYVKESTKTFEFNLDKTVASSAFDEHVFGKVSLTLPRFIDDLISKYSKT